MIHQEFPLIEAPEQIGLNPRPFDEELHSEGRPCQVLQTGVDSLARLYRLEDEQQVRAFVDRFPFLAVLLLEAHEAISVLFPDSPASLSIHRYHDEIEEEELVVWIHTSLSVDAAMDRLDALAESWWLDNMGRAEGKLGFDLRFS